MGGRGTKGGQERGSYAAGRERRLDRTESWSKCANMRARVYFSGEHVKLGSHRN